MKNQNQDKIAQKLTDDIVNTYQDDSGINFIDVANLPVRDKVIELLDLLIELIFPGYMGKRIVTRDNVNSIVGDILVRIRTELAKQIELALRHQCRMANCPTCDCNKMAVEVTDYLLAQIPAIRGLLKDDVQAAFDGDPAAQSFDEIIISYPCIIAIATHRISHELYKKDVPLIPRIMSESAHSKTGIDIHPGATLGKRFFIDHGTGVVVGETSEIGDNVKFYQGVSLVAVSIPKDAQSIKGTKRHPTIEDDATIYAEATILGNITIGKGAIIGANAWVKESVPPAVTVAMAKPKSVIKRHQQ
ncbi:MAG TPA: serine acetyltransferase [Phycisphaerales bacterium]|nr:serine acetyltransferase [Phycisphaerales bacterium]